MLVCLDTNVMLMAFARSSPTVAIFDAIITNDTHFEALANAGYKPQLIAPVDFIARYL
jgi:hypothetical protein